MALLVALSIWGAFPKLIQAQRWEQTSAPITNWAAIACSTDCSKLVAAANANAGLPGALYSGPLFTSADGGTTWQQASTPITNWMSVACSADGAKIFAIAEAYPGGDSFWISTNGGARWIATNNPAVERWIASSADGMKLFAEAVNNCVATSADGGATWSMTCFPVLRTLLTGVSSADGSKLAALVIDSTSTVFWLEASTNGGASWDELPGPDNSNNYGSLACSADGTTLLASISLIGVFTSSDWGQSWHQFGPAPAQWEGFVISADGTKLFRTDGTAVYRSIDSGGSWTNIEAPNATWGPLASSADGNTLVAAAAGGGIYIWREVSSLELNIAQIQGSIVLSWNAPSNTILQQCTDLTLGVWTPMTITPTLTNGQYQLIVPATNGSRLFRLKGA